MSVANCAKCGKVFQKALSPFCPACLQESQQQLSEAYRYLQRHPKTTLEEVSARCGIPYKELERLYFDGKLGTAASGVIYHCQRCNVPMTGIMRRGRFCLSCTEQIEVEGGVHHPDSREPDKPRSVNGRVEPSPAESSSGTPRGNAPANASKPASAAGDSYGFKRITEV